LVLELESAIVVPNDVTPIRGQVMVDEYIHVLKAEENK